MTKNVLSRTIEALRIIPGLLMPEGMMKFHKIIRAVLAVFSLSVMMGASGAALAVDRNKELMAMDMENTLYLDLAFGRIVIAMRPDLAPNHVKRIKELARKGYYDEVVFHRVIEGFMAQTGDPTGTGTGGTGQKLKAEFSREMHLRGTVSMARASDPDSADSQFFICLAPAPHLNGQYTVWGKVVSGMEFLDMVKKGEAFNNGIVNDPTKILRVRVAADVK